MSNPAFADIGSTSAQMPGFSTGPVPGNFGISSPGIAFANWMPTGAATNRGNMAAFTKGGVPPKSHGHVTFRSNDFITHAYTIVPWGDDSHLQIREGMAVFIGTEMDQKTNLTNMVHLGKLNRLAQQARVDFDVLSDPNNPDYDPEAVRFRELLAKHGEKGLEQHHWARMTGRVRNWVEGNQAKGSAWILERDGTVNAGDTSNRYPGQRRPETALTNYAESELDELWRLAQQPVYCYITKFGIMTKWNFIGFVVAVSNPTSQPTLDNASSRDNVLSVTVGIAKRVRCGAYWGTRKTLRVGAKCKLVLRAKQLSDGSYGAFEIVPFTLWKRTHVPPADVQYYDESGDLVSGHVWSVGTVIEPPKRDGQEAQRQLAAGTSLDSTSKMAYEAFGNIPVFYLAVGM